MDFAWRLDCGLKSDAALNMLKMASSFHPKQHVAEATLAWSPDWVGSPVLEQVWKDIPI